MIENIEPSSSNQPKPIQPLAEHIQPLNNSSFQQIQMQSSTLGSMFAKLSKGDQKMATQMLSQTLHLASITIMSQMNHFVQTMREHNQDV